MPKHVTSNSLVLNVLDWGAKGDNATDDTAAIQACIDYAATLTSTSTVVYLPPLYYKVRTLNMKKGVTLQGANRDMTRLYAIAGDTSPALITIDAIYVDHMWINDIGLRGAGAANPGQHGIYAYARNASEAFSTGWGNGGMNRCVVKDFQGSQLWLRGGGGTRGYWQNQFLEFNHCDFYADYTVAASKSVYITGKNGQLTWVQCQFNTSGGTSESAGTNLVIKQEVDDAGANISTGRSYALHFSNCSVEARSGGIEIEGAFNVTFDTTFMEALAFAIKTTGDHRSVMFVNTHWANAASNIALTGVLVNNTASNQVLLVGGSVLGVANKAWAGPVDPRGIFTDAVLTSSNVTGQFAVSAGAINIRGYKTGLVNSPGTVDTITSSMHPGEMVTLKAFGGDLSLTSAGNINLAGNSSPFIVPNGAFVTLVRTDLGTAGWVLVAASPQDPIVKSPNGTRFRIGVADDGALTTTSL